MLLDRSRPNDQQKFSDYLNDLGRKNGFSNLNVFKSYLITSSKERYHIYSANNINIFRVISGLFIELGIDLIDVSDVVRPKCFKCLDRYPQGWSWNKIAEHPCVGVDAYACKKNELLQQAFKTKNKEEYCGLIKCSMSKLGLSTSSLPERFYFADLIPEGTLSSNKYGLLKTYL